MRTVLLAIAAATLTSACFHATVETGLPASQEVVSTPWAHGFLLGLVPPPTVETANRCGAGVAKVETQLSLRNMLAATLTGGLYAPMQIDVTCAVNAKSAALLPARPVSSSGAETRFTDSTAAAVRRP